TGPAAAGDGQVTCWTSRLHADPRGHTGQQQHQASQDTATGSPLQSCAPRPGPAPSARPERRAPRGEPRSRRPGLRGVPASLLLRAPARRGAGQGTGGLRGVAPLKRPPDAPRLLGRTAFPGQGSSRLGRDGGRGAPGDRGAPGRERGLAHGDSRRPTENNGPGETSGLAGPRRRLGEGGRPWAPSDARRAGGRGCAAAPRGVPEITLSDPTRRVGAPRPEPHGEPRARGTTAGAERGRPLPARPRVGVGAGRSLRALGGGGGDPRPQARPPGRARRPARPDTRRPPAPRRSLRPSAVSEGRGKEDAGRRPRRRFARSGRASRALPLCPVRRRLRSLQDGRRGGAESLQPFPLPVRGARAVGWAVPSAEGTSWRKRTLRRMRSCL
ncbi:collagen alpha-1(I) chain-like, partial [Mustela putorius furo]|uniref:Collagen alpha-1(I) chain-like n=1 Tax=Mustela putorius furo TaxID=9669 RepID=A0A8U0RB27_MUSPF